MALGADRNTPQQGAGGVIPLLSVPLKASTKVYKGSLVVSDAGYLAPGRAATGLIALGCAQAQYDNSAGSNGTISGNVLRGTFYFANSSAGDAIAQANCQAPCYIVDDQTVALTDGNGTRSLAGTVIAVDSGGVWVEVGFGQLDTVSPQYPSGSWTINIPALSALANAQSYKFTPGFAGRVKSVQFMVTTAVTTGSKAATLTLKVATVAATGGVISLTSANCTPIGAEVDGTAITGGNTFTAAQQLSMDVSAVTAFAEGAGQIVVVFG